MRAAREDPQLQAEMLEPVAPVPRPTYLCHVFTHMYFLTCLNPCGVQCGGAIFGARVFPV